MSAEQARAYIKSGHEVAGQTVAAENTLFADSGRVEFYFNVQCHISTKQVNTLAMLWNVKFGNETPTDGGQFLAGLLGLTTTSDDVIRNLRGVVLRGARRYAKAKNLKLPTSGNVTTAAGSIRGVFIRFKTAEGTLSQTRVHDGKVSQILPGGKEDDKSRRDIGEAELTAIYLAVGKAGFRALIRVGREIEMRAEEDAGSTRREAVNE